MAISLDATARPHQVGAQSKIGKPQSNMMGISRRDFLYYAACLPAGSLARASGRGAHRSVSSYCECRSKTSAAVLLLDFSCTLKESLEGYHRAIKAAAVPSKLASGVTAETARLIVAPAAALTDPGQARWLRRQIEQGTTALVESGGAFLSPAAFQVQRHLVRSQLELAMLGAVRLWEERGSLSSPPYVDFTWPSAAKIRDFTRVIPLDGTNGQVIAAQQNRIVGLKGRLGAGTLVFLGSPVGPHLLAGDREAQRWFESMLQLA